MRMKVALDITRKRVLTALLLIVIVAFPTFVIGTNMGYHVGVKRGLKEGYLKALSDVSEKTGITFEWKDLGDGQYEIVAFFEGGLFAKGVAEVHLWIEHFRNGKLLTQQYGAGVLTTIGQDWIEQQLAASDGTQEALYCADSNDASAPSAAWTILPGEMSTDGLDRQDGTYTSTGTGTWNVTVTKSITGTNSTQLWGLHWVTTDLSDNNLLAADSGPSQKNVVSGDTLQETWQVTVT